MTTQTQYQIVCLDADNIARVGSIALSWQEAMADLAARNAMLTRPDKTQSIKIILTHYITIRRIDETE